MRKSIPLVLLCIGTALVFSTLPVQAATTEVHVVKYASDTITILNEMTVTYRWIEETLPVCGDEITHYFHQGPVLEDEWNETHPGEPYDPWNPQEDVNVVSRDLGAVRGTDIKDLCELVGGMSPGDELMIHASDGFRTYFDYTNVYEPQARQGPLVLTWWRAEEGYVPDYSSGMRLIFFADTSTNPWGWHVFGNWDMHECLATERWHNYSAVYPSTSGVSVKCVDEIAIYSLIAPPEVSSIKVSPADVTLDEDETQQFNATAYDEEGNEMSTIRFLWTSSNENVGIVDDTGLFEATNAGTTTIMVENGTITGTANVAVHDNEDSRDRGDNGEDAQSSPVLTAINVSPSSVTLNARDTQQFNATAYDQLHHEMGGVVFNWTSSNETVGSMNNTGFFRAIASGTTTIKATNGTVNGTTNATVFTPAPSPPETRPVNVTPSPSPGSITTPAPTPSPSPTPAPSATPLPGFEALFTIIDLLAVAYVITRRKTG